MNNNIFFSADYDNKNFTSLFDRIINIKFTRQNGDTFTLRSDYEPVWNGKQLYFKTCQPKPEIRVQYTQYQSTMINVDIFVTNLNIIEYKDNKAQASASMVNPVRSGVKTNQPNDLLTRFGNPVIKAEIEMGYRGNFHDWAHTVIPPNDQEAYYNAFMNLQLPSREVRQENLALRQSLFGAQRRCTVRVEWAINTNNPPDRVTQFHGYVGETEAGFQPYALMALDNISDPGKAGKITATDMIKELNDTYSTIDEVEYITETTKTKPKEKKKSKKVVVPDIIRTKQTTYRNFFNGGKGFTSFEAYCFHTITRRFVRADAEVKRNELLEQAALEYALASNYPDRAQQLSEIKKELTQSVYNAERKYIPSSFVEENGEISFSSSAPDIYRKFLEKKINKYLIDTYIGARYIVKNLPEYRTLYDAMRETILKATTRKESMAWWEAATQITTTPKIVSADTNTVSIKEDIQSIKKYILDSEEGAYEGKNCRLGDSNEWILPLQTMAKSAPLKTAHQTDAYFYPPTEISDAGFVETSKSVKKNLKCFSGLFEIRDAYLFGVPVICSSKASEIFENQQAGKSFVEFKFLSDLKTQIEWICQTWNLLYYTLHNGGFFIYSSSEKEIDIAAQDFVKNQSSSSYRIPAVYDITLGPIRKIRMPFMTFLNPMSVVEWNSTSAIGEMISFYYQPEKGRNFFMVIKNEIDFSTTEDYNMMQIDLVDTPYSDRSTVPAALIKQDNIKTFVEVIIVPDKDKDGKLTGNTWQRIYESPICKIPAELLPLWGEKTDNKNTDYSEDFRVSPLQFFTLMKTWNPGLFDAATEKGTGWDWLDNLRRVDKKADRLYGEARPDPKVHFPDINYCLSLLSDETAKRIYALFPCMPNESDYSSMKQYNESYVLVYENGVWSMELKEAMEIRFKIGALN